MEWTATTDYNWITTTDKADRILKFQYFIKIFNNELVAKNEPFLKDRKDYLAEIDELFEI